MATEDGRKKWTYALVAEQAEAAPLPECELRKIAESINQQSEVFSVPYKVFLAPGSLWIIIRSEGQLQMPAFLKGVQELIQQRQLGGEICKAVPNLMRVPLHAVPRRLLNLVYQVENLLESSGCLWLRALDVQKLATDSINRSNGDVQLNPLQVIVFEDSVEAERLSWLNGNGKLRFVIERNWRDLKFQDGLLERLNELASRSTGMSSSPTWGEHSAFHAVAFLLHRRVMHWGLEETLSDCEHPAVLLQRVLQKVLGEGQVLKEQMEVARGVQETLWKLATDSHEEFKARQRELYYLFPDQTPIFCEVYKRIFREVDKRRQESSTGTFDLLGSSSQVRTRQSETSTNLPNASSNLPKNLPETGLEDSDSPVGGNLLQRLLDIASDPTETEDSIFQEALATAEAQKGCERGRVAILHELDVLNREKHELFEATKCLQKSVKMKLMAKAETHQVVAKIVELGRVLHETHDARFKTYVAVNFTSDVMAGHDYQLDAEGRGLQCFAKAFYELGIWKKGLDDLHDAEEYFTTSLALEYAFDETQNDVSFASTLHELGSVWKSKGKKPAAAICLQEALYRKRKANCQDIKLIEEELESLMPLRSEKC